LEENPLRKDQGTYATQKLVSILLNDLNKLCEKLNISYFLYGGCLIGSVRHGGFVPWDDDIDIVMTCKDL
jgi:lipopolysaccharide cholinephosphotransferase